MMGSSLSSEMLVAVWFWRMYGLLIDLYFQTSL